MKVDQKHVHGEIEKDEKDAGSKLHEELIQLKPTDLETLIGDIKQKKFTLASMPLIGSLKNITIIGTPDTVAFYASKPLYVMELKTTMGKPTVWFDSWLQAQIYAFLLEEMGFDCSKLNVAVASIRQQGEVDRGSFYHELLRAIIEAETDDFAVKRSCRMRLEPFDRGFVEDKVGWALDYWLMKRDPIPTSKPSKCRSCEYATLCPTSKLSN
ncbi:MAG: PD-(D/E)XK nuclease family protein [Candidatus Bathyarchaeota archaeon]